MRVLAKRSQKVWIPCTLSVTKNKVGFPGGAVVKNLPANEATDKGVISKIYKQLMQLNIKKNQKTPGFPGGAVVENLPANAGDMGSSPGLGGSHMPRSN